MLGKKLLWQSKELLSIILRALRISIGFRGSQTIGFPIRLCMRIHPENYYLVGNLILKIRWFNFQVFGRTTWFERTDAVVQQADVRSNDATLRLILMLTAPKNSLR